VLVLTIGNQVYNQWKTGSSKGVSKWLFVGQITASTGFTLYSLMVHNWVFVVTNSLLLVSARRRDLMHHQPVRIDAGGQEGDRRILSIHGHPDRPQADQRAVGFGRGPRLVPRRRAGERVVA